MSRRDTISPFAGLLINITLQNENRGQNDLLFTVSFLLGEDDSLALVDLWPMYKVELLMVARTASSHILSVFARQSTTIAFQSTKLG